MLTIQVSGNPAPKGSSRAIIRGRHAVVVPGSSNVGLQRMQSWSSAVRQAAREAVGAIESPAWIQTPLAVTIAFYLARPGGHWTKEGTIKPSAPPYPGVKPDIDKLARTTLDALTGIVFDDDSRIVVLSAEKHWAYAGQEGAHITVESLVDTAGPAVRTVTAADWAARPLTTGMPKWDRNA